jgi:hypothetical protein
MKKFLLLWLLTFTLYFNTGDSFEVNGKEWRINPHNPYMMEIMNDSGEIIIRVPTDNLLFIKKEIK